MNVKKPNYIYEITCEACGYEYTCEIEENEVTFGGKNISFKGKLLSKGEISLTPCPNCGHENELVGS